MLPAIVSQNWAIFLKPFQTNMPFQKKIICKLPFCVKTIHISSIRPKSFLRIQHGTDQTHN